MQQQKHHQQKSSKSSLVNRFNVYLSNRPSCPTINPEKTQLSQSNKKKLSKQLSSTSRITTHIQYLQNKVEEKQKIIEEKIIMIEELSQKLFKLNKQIGREKQKSHRLQSIIKEYGQEVEKLKGKVNDKKIIEELDCFNQVMEQNMLADDQSNKIQSIEEEEEESGETGQLCNLSSAKTIKKQTMVRLEFGLVDTESQTESNDQKDQVKELEHAIYYIKSKYQKLQKEHQQFKQITKSHTQNLEMLLEREKQVNQDLTEKMAQLQSYKSSSVCKQEKFRQELEKPIEELLRLCKVKSQETERQRSIFLENRVMELEKRIQKNEESFNLYKREHGKQNSGISQGQLNGQPAL